MLSLAKGLDPESGGRLSELVDRRAVAVLSGPTFAEEIADGLPAAAVIAGKDARLRLHFHARFVYVVLGGRGTAQALVDGKPTGSFAVNADRLYRVVSGVVARDGLLELRFSPGVTAYSFTFG